MKHKHEELIKAWAEGAEIQYMSNGKWYDAKTPAWNNETNEFRIKPTRNVVMWQWIVRDVMKMSRPFITNSFYRSRSQVREDLGSDFVVLHKADWTKTEFEE